MNIQIFGKKKCFDTKKAERFFKERRIKYQYIDLDRYGMSRGEFSSVRRAVGFDKILDEKHPDAELVRSYASDEQREDAFYDDPTLIHTPVVRCGKAATVGYCPQVWLEWIEKEK